MATFYHGDPIMVDYTPGAAVTAGDVVVVDRSPMIAHRDIAANVQGALACQGGVYTELAAAAIVAGREVYWDNTAKRVTTTNTGNQRLGFSVSASTGAGASINFFHMPDGKIAA